LEVDVDVGVGVVLDGNGNVDVVDHLWRVAASWRRATRHTHRLALRRCSGRLLPQLGHEHRRRASDALAPDQCVSG